MNGVLCSQSSPIRGFAGLPRENRQCDVLALRCIVEVLRFRTCYTLSVSFATIFRGLSVCCVVEDLLSRNQQWFVLRGFEAINLEMGQFYERDSGTSDAWKSTAKKRRSSGSFYSVRRNSITNVTKNTLAFIRHQRWKLYILRRCVIMLITDGREK